MDKPLPTPKLSNSGLAAIAVLSTNRYMKLAVPHNLAAEIGSPQIEAAYRTGSWPHAGWLQQAVRDAEGHLLRHRRNLTHAGLSAVAIFAISMVVAAAFGKVHTSLPLDVGKVVSSIGGVVAGWGALLQFIAPNRTFRGNLIHEIVHTATVRALVISGLVLAALGTLWWR